MLAACSKCRTTTDIRLKIDNPGGLKITKASAQDPSVKLQPVCMKCGSKVVLSPFTVNLMIDKHDFIPEEKTKSKAKCHACQSNQEVKLDREHKPRCMRCGGVVKITKFMVKAMEEELKIFMTEEEMAKWDL